VEARFRWSSENSGEAGDTEAVSFFEDSQPTIVKEKLGMAIFRSENAVRGTYTQESTGKHGN
jgi:hypothetical protein